MKLKLSSTALLNIVLVLLLVGGLGYSGYSAWQIMHGGEVATPFANSGQQNASLAPVPDLSLHLSHQRQGAVIQVQPNTLGRNNPFK